MAQRRVNVQAVGIILGVFVVLLVTVVLGSSFLRHRDPKRYITLAELDLRNDNLPGAAANYQQAVNADPNKNLEVRVAYGDVLHKLARIDDSYQGQDLAMWNSVLERDPANKEALQRMLQAVIEVVEFNPRPDYIGRLHDLSERILKLPLDGGKDEQEKRKNADLQASAKAYLRISVIAAWLADIVKPEEEIRDNTDALARLLRESVDTAVSLGDKAPPINPDIPYYLGAAYVRQARELRTQNKSKEADVLEKKAYSMFDSVVQAQPKNAVLRLRFSQILRSISDVLDDDSKDDRQEYIKRMKEVLEEAHTSVALNDPAFTEVYIFYAQYLQRNKDAAGAEKLLRELCERKPEDQSARLELARLLHPDPKKREEAIELLKRPVTDATEGKVTPRSRVALEKQTLADLTNYLIEAYSATSDETKRAELTRDIEENYQKLVDRMGITAMTLKLKGRISLMKGGQNAAIDAIPDLEKAKEMLALLNPARPIHDWELEFFLALAYVDSNQTGPAKKELGDIINALPNFTPARAMLARLLTIEHDVDGAQEQVTEIERRTPDDPQIAKLKIGIYFISDQKKVNAEEIEKVLAGMPESTTLEIRNKIQVCVYAGKIDETIRLFEVLRSRSPADVETVRSLAQIYMSRSKKDLAIKVADEALAKDPKNISLQIVRAQIDKDQPKVLELTRQGIEAISDPANREMSFYEFYNAQDNKTEALKHLALAEKADPESIRIMDLRFGLALMGNQWDVAEKYANRLAVKNGDEANGLIYRYRLALVQGKLKAAEAFARELVKSKPQYARSYLCYGDVLKDQHQYEEAAAKYQIALEKQPENIEAYRGLIECYYSLKKPEEARRYIDGGLKVLPDNPWLREQQIAYYLNYDDPAKALAPREKAAQNNPESLGAQLAFAATQWQVGQHFAQKGKTDPAKEFADKARQTFAAIVEKWPDDRLAYAYLADIATYSNDFAAGEAVLKQLASRDKWKTQSEAYVLLADYYFRFGKAEQAEAAYEQALGKLTSQTDPSAIEVEQKAAAFLTSQKKYDKALKVLEPAKSSRRVKQQIVETLLAENKLTEAGQLLDRYLQENPTDSQFMATRGFLMLQEKRIPESLAIMNKAVDLDPSNQTALYYRGMIKLRQGPGSIEDAIKDLTAARDITNDPAAQVGVTSQIQTRVALAEALRAHNQIDEAVGEMQICLDLQPGNKEIRVRLIEMLGTLVTPRWAEVEKLLADAQKMKDFEKDPDWRRLSATMWVARNQPEKALASIREAIALTEGQMQRTLPLMEDYLNILARLKKYQELQAECDNLLKYPAITQSSWWIYHMRAIAQANSDGKRADALNDFDKALEIAGRLRNDDAVVMIIQSIADTIGLEPAISRCEREASKGDNHWRVILTYLYFSKKDYKSAQETIEKVLADDANLTPRERETALGVAGSVYMLSADYKKAEQVYQRLLALSDQDKTRDPDTVSLNNLACIWTDYMDPPDPAKALSYSQRAMDVMQGRGLPDPNIMDTHGWVLVNNGKIDEGITYIQAAVDKRNMLEAKYHMGMALLKKNLGPEALQQLDRARRMLDDRKNKGLATDQTMETRLNEGLVKARQLVNGIGVPATAPVSSGTGDGLKP